MNRLTMQILMLAVMARSALTSLGERRTERGDVPGWVMITVMTAGLVAALWVIAGDTLKAMLHDALASVHG